MGGPRSRRLLIALGEGLVPVVALAAAWLVAVAVGVPPVLLDREITGLDDLFWLGPYPWPRLSPGFVLLHVFLLLNVTALVHVRAYLKGRSRMPGRRLAVAGLIPLLFVAALIVSAVTRRLDTHDWTLEGGSSVGWYFFVVIVVGATCLWAADRPGKEIGPVITLSIVELSLAGVWWNTPGEWAGAPWPLLYVWVVAGLVPGLIRFGMVLIFLRPRVTGTVGKTGRRK